MIHIFSDYDEVERELDRLAAVPTLAHRAALGAVLNEALAIAVANVDVDTGALKKSVKAKDSWSGTTDTWRGTITFGGHANSKVDYAYYEHRRRGRHDLLSVLSVMHPQWVAAIKGMLSP
jgi:hypothetical protein